VLYGKGLHQLVLSLICLGRNAGLFDELPKMSPVGKRKLSGRSSMPLCQRIDARRALTADRSWGLRVDGIAIAEPQKHKSMQTVGCDSMNFATNNRASVGGE